MSADGKITDARHGAARFPSAADGRHLEQCLSTADATLFGANTLRAYGTTALITNPTLLEQRRQQKRRRGFGALGEQRQRLPAGFGRGRGRLPICRDESQDFSDGTRLTPPSEACANSNPWRMPFDCL